MYFPFFRGRQFELLALQECVKSKILSDKIIPILEPIKVSSTYINTIETFNKFNKQIAIVRNPQVGNWFKGINEETEEIRKIVDEQLISQNVISSFYVNSNLSTDLIDNKCFSSNDFLFIYNNPDYLDTYSEIVEKFNPKYNIVPDKTEFRRTIRKNRVLCEDHFVKRNRNVDYSNIIDEFFSSDHLYYAEDGYKGFSDYSIIGEEYNDSGFAPYAVAIHIIYFDKKSNLRIAHFVSDSNDDIKDPARKFEEAVKKMVIWNKEMKLNTIGIKKLEECYAKQNYPGLGVLKKYSIMHHLELMSKFLDGK